MELITVSTSVVASLSSSSTSVVGLYTYLVLLPELRETEVRGPLKTTLERMVLAEVLFGGWTAVSTAVLPLSRVSSLLGRPSLE